MVFASVSGPAWIFSNTVGIPAPGVVQRESADTFYDYMTAGLGGGTGSGGAPVIARRLKKLYVEPVYGLGILPARDEGGLYSLNAARSLMTFVKEVFNHFLLVAEQDFHDL